MGCFPTASAQTFTGCMRPARDVLRSGYLGFSLEPMLQIVSGNASTRGKQIVGPPGYFSMGRFYGGMVLVVVWCPNRRVDMN